LPFDEQKNQVCFTSSDLVSWEKHEDIIDMKGFPWATRAIWAPTVIDKDGKYYYIFASGDIHSEETKGGLEIAVSDSPIGPFRAFADGPLVNGFHNGAQPIDAHLFKDDDGTVYLYYVRLGDGNRIFVAKMKDDLSGIEEEYPDCLIEATEPWETIDCLIAEGPFVIKHKGLYYLTYSCNHTRCIDYAVGYAVSKSPLGPFERFEKNPILKKSENLIGVGHHSFFYSEDKTLCCAYHCHNTSSGYFKPRMSCINTAEFVEGENGIDILVINGPK
jgi:beta-xylosidase